MGNNRNSLQIDVFMLFRFLNSYAEGKGACSQLQVTVMFNMLAFHRLSHKVLVVDQLTDYDACSMSSRTFRN